jgi:hypothetical protein
MLEVADRWVARTGEGLIPLILDEFGAVELMVSAPTGMDD